jgi:hypothetical protein
LSSEEGDLQCRFGRRDDIYFIDFPRLACFAIAANGGKIHYQAASGINSSDMAALLLTQALPLSLHLQGRVVLHASAVRFGKGSSAFLGPQGQGKSTLSAAFHARGFSLLSDDALPIFSRAGKIWAQPSLPEIRLYQATAKRLLGKDPLSKAQPALEKFRIELGSCFSKKPMPLRNIYCLRTAGKVGIRPLNPSEAYPLLLASSFRVDIDNQSRLLQEWSELASLVERVRVFSLEYPRSLKQIDTVVDAVLKEEKIL